MFLLFNLHITFYTSYLGFNYVNTIGFILISLYVIQLVSGLQLSLYYNYSLSYYAFDTIQFIMKDVNLGYIIRVFHIIGSSFYMGFLWLHLLRGLFIKLFFYSFISNSCYTNSSYTSFTSIYNSFRFNSVSSAAKQRSFVSSLFEFTRSFNGLCLFFQLLRFILPSLNIYSSNLYNSNYSNFRSSSLISSFSSLISINSHSSSSFLVPFSVYLHSFPQRSSLTSSSVAQSVAHSSSSNYSFVQSFRFAQYSNFYYVYFIGIVIFFISIAVSFIGYTLVFGNLSYYGVIVILGLVSSLPSLLSYLIQFFILFILLIFFILFISFLFSQSSFLFPSVRFIFYFILSSLTIVRPLHFTRQDYVNSMRL